MTSVAVTGAPFVRQGAPTTPSRRHKIHSRQRSIFIHNSSDVNKDWTCKDKDETKPTRTRTRTRTRLARTRTRTRTSLTVTYCKLQLNLQSLWSNNN